MEEPIEEMIDCDYLGHFPQPGIKLLPEDILEEIIGFYKKPVFDKHIFPSKKCLVDFFNRTDFLPREYQSIVDEYRGHRSQKEFLFMHDDFQLIFGCF